MRTSKRDGGAAETPSLFLCPLLVWWMRPVLVLPSDVKNAGALGGLRIKGLNYYFFLSFIDILDFQSMVYLTTIPKQSVVYLTTV